MDGYYCNENKQCKAVPITDIDTNGPSGTYKNNIVTRSKGCFGLCDEDNNSGMVTLSNAYHKNNSYVKIAVVLLSILILVLIYIL